MRRRLGFKLHEAGLRLKDFVSFMEERRARRITSALALSWAQRPRDVQPVIWAQRLGVVRDFARYLSAFEPRTEVPPTELLPHRYRRRAPYLYTDQEIQKILAATLELYPPSAWPMDLPHADRPLERHGDEARRSAQSRVAGHRPEGMRIDGSRQ